MKTSQFRLAKRKQADARVRRRRRLVALEALEGRALLSLSPQMILDINTTTASSLPGAITAVGSIAYFTADDGVHGRELWKSDGTESGTALVKNILVGTPDYSSSPRSLTAVDGTLFFVANDGFAGFELWKSDGTAAGTVMVKDIDPNGWSQPTNLTNVNGTLYFTANDGVNGYELWKSDGTAAGTVMVKDIAPGGPYTSSGVSNLTNVNGTLFFTADDGVNGWELWKSNGTPAGTVMVKNIVTGGDGSYPQFLVNVGGTVFFSARTAANGTELWKSDGTSAGTVLVKDVLPGSDNSYPQSLTNVGGTLFFTASSPATGRVIWKSDGTAAGTVMVSSEAATPRNLADVNGTLFFVGNRGTETELWKSDGTSAGTAVVKDINTLPADNTYPQQLTDVNGTLFFQADDGVNGRRLWMSDGTESGTVMVNSDAAAPRNLANVNGTLFFMGSHGKDAELWKSDGTSAGTAVVKDINTIRADNAYPQQLTDVNGTLFFVADDGVNGRELWKSDGTIAGTTLVKDLTPRGYFGYYGGYYPNSSDVSNLTNINGTLFFSRGGWELWKSDGTAAGTVRVAPGYGIRNLTNVDGTLYFSSSSSTIGAELWKSDGTESGTTLVKDIATGGQWIYQGGGYYSSGTWEYIPNSSDPSSLTNVNGTLYFVASSPGGDLELWKSDGTEAGTVRVKDIFPGDDSSLASGITNVNGTLFFSARDGLTNGVELWKSDGTEAGTVLIKDIRPGSAGSYPSRLTNINGTLFFSANDGVNGWELWKSDGTAAGTVMVKDINPGTSGSFLSELTNVNGTVFFAATSGTSGHELWTSDGTAAGTVMVKDINPTGSSNPRGLTNLDGTLLFLADGPAGTQRPWKSDGTAVGTSIVADVLTSGIKNVGGTAYFTADDGTHGNELWKLVEDGLPTPPALSILGGTVTEGHAGTRALTFNVTLSAVSTQTVTVGYASADGTATAGADYQAVAGTLTFLPGETSKTITVLVNGDRVGESDESFVVNLSGASNATITDIQGLGTITDDEPRITINDVTKTEGNTGTTSFVFTVTLSSAYDQPVTVNYATADYTATASGDYTAVSGTLTIPAGKTTGTITVLVKGDRVGEYDESFFVNLTGANYAGIADNQAVGTITDDEPWITISDVTKSEGNSGTTSFVFTVTLSFAYDQPVTVKYATSNGSATVKSGDYTAASGTLTIPAGKTTGTITVKVKGDTKRENDESFFVNLSNAKSARITDDVGLGTILNDDTAARPRPPSRPRSVTPVFPEPLFGCPSWWKSSPLLALLISRGRIDSFRIGPARER